MSERVKVLYVMGAGRSGSTIVDNILGEFDGFASVGELHNVWKRGIVRGRECGCGLPLAECSVWSEILSGTARRLGLEELDAPAVRAAQEESLQMRHTRKVVRTQADAVSGWKSLDDYVRVLGETYRSIADVMGARVIVDSSKRPPAAAALHLAPGIEPYYLHLVRDPRAVAYSRTRVKKSAEGHEMRREKARRTTGRWVFHNSLAEIVHRNVPADRYTLLRYEDFVRSPRTATETLVNFTGEEVSGSPFTSERSVTLHGNHTAAGNPSRFKTGSIDIREDKEWRDRIRTVDYLVATAMAAPFMRRYGYTLRGRSEGTVEQHPGDREGSDEGRRSLVG